MATVLARLSVDDICSGSVGIILARSFLWSGKMMDASRFLLCSRNNSRRPSLMDSIVTPHLLYIAVQGVPEISSYQLPLLDLHSPF